MEKDVLKDLVQNALNNGRTRANIDWDKIAENLAE
jgi:hypothetical protein